MEKSKEDTAFQQARRQQWAMLIQRIYEVDPMECPKCGGQMVVIELLPPPQEKVIDKILKHCGLWEAPSQRAPPRPNGFTKEPDKAVDMEYVDINTFLSEL